MTVSSELNRKEYAGNGATTSFATSPVVFFDSDELDVYVVTTATGVVDATLTLNTHYTVSGGSGSTGIVDLSGGSSPYGAPAAGKTLVIVRTLDITQEADFVNNDASDAEVAEDALDRLTMICQQLNATLDRSFTLADTDVSGASTTIPTPAATSLIGWNGAGTALQNYSTSVLSTALTTAFTLTLLDDVDADAVFQTLVDGATAETAPASGDFVLISDVSLTPDDGRKVTLANVMKVVGGLTLETAPAVGDLFAIYDISASDSRSMTLENMLKVVNGLTEDTAPDETADFLLVYDTSASGVKKVKPSSLEPTTVVATQVSTSGTAIDFSSIPSGVKQIVIALDGVSLSGTDNLIVQIGDAGGLETSGYTSASNSAAAGTQSTAGFILQLAVAANTVDHTVTLNLVDSSTNKWTATHTGQRSDNTVFYGHGKKALSAELDRVRVTRTGTDTFDAGSISLAYQK